MQMQLLFILGLYLFIYLFIYFINTIIIITSILIFKFYIPRSTVWIIVSFAFYVIFCHAFYTWASGWDLRGNLITRIGINKWIDWLIDWWLIDWLTDWLIVCTLAV